MDKHSRTRTRIMITVTVAVLALMGLWTHQAGAELYNDGLTHTFDGESDQISVKDSPEGESTTVNIVEPAVIRGGIDWTSDSYSDFYYYVRVERDEDIDSIISKATHGGKAIVNILGGTLMRTVNSWDASCTTISGGTIGFGHKTVSVRVDSPSDPALVKIEDGILEGAVWALSNSWVHIAGGSFGADSNHNALLADARSGTALVEIENGVFQGGVKAGANSHLHITGGSFDTNNLFSSVVADAPSGTALVEIENGVFQGGVKAWSNSHLHITGGSFGIILPNFSSLLADARSGTALVEIENGVFQRGVEAWSNSHLHITGGSFGTIFPTLSSVVADAPSGTALVEIENGVFQGSVEACSNSHLHITGGSFGPFIDPSDPENENLLLSVKAYVGSGPETASVEIRGGTFSHGLEAGRNGIIDVYGTNLQINSGILSGTLSDGTPINLPVRTVDNGQIILHNADNLVVLSVSTGGWLFSFNRGCYLDLPAHLAPSSPDCSGGVYTQLMCFEVMGVYDPSSGGNNSWIPDTTHGIFWLKEEAQNPGQPPFEDEIRVKLTDFHLMTVEKVALDMLNSPQHLFVTLSEEEESVGTMTVNFHTMRYEGALELSYDIRAGAVDGPIIHTATETYKMEGAWTTDPPEGVVLIPGVNEDSFPVDGGRTFTGPTLNLVGTVTTTNHRPVAVATAIVPEVCDVAAGTPVTLDGSGSSDPDGDPLVYVWSGPFPEGGGMVTGVMPTVTLPLGPSTITLRVNDGPAESFPVTVDVQVNAAVTGLEPPLAALTPDGEPPILPDKAFKAGCTLPLKLQLGCSSAPLTNTDVFPPFITEVERTGDAFDVEIDPEDSGMSNDDTNVFRFAEDGTWIYNFSTKGYNPGTYSLKIRMPDFRVFQAGFVLR